MMTDVVTTKLTSRMFAHPRHSVLTGPISLGPSVHPMGIDLWAEPDFIEMLNEWGYEPLGIPWTGKQIIKGRVLDPEELREDV